MFGHASHPLAAAVVADWTRVGIPVHGDGDGHAHVVGDLALRLPDAASTGVFLSWYAPAGDAEPAALRDVAGSCLLEPAAHEPAPWRPGANSARPRLDGETSRGREVVAAEGGRLSAEGSPGLQPDDRPHGLQVRPGYTAPSAATYR
ncbi:hypothetical protein [Streptomyces sp. NPDC050263]|uniref:hypothetical protein n=1 Tax=Streptomyces sp. NPDC050263 TaxID=3155037 RepID=UPI00342D2B66